MDHREIIVVVDDEGWLRRALAPLAADGLDVVRAGTALAALSACVASDPLCVVTDLDLADHDGLWLAAALRDGDGPTSAVPLVLCADRPSVALCASAIAAGVDVIVDRGGSLGELRTSVRALVSMARRLRADASRRVAKAEARARSDARSLAATGRSGTQRKVPPPSQPSHAVREEVLPSARSDPRAEPLDDIPTRRHVWGK